MLEEQGSVSHRLEVHLTAAPAHQLAPMIQAHIQYVLYSSNAWGNTNSWITMTRALFPPRALVRPRLRSDESVKRTIIMIRI